MLQADARQEFIANRDQNMFLGVYPTWEEAVRASEAYGTSGYDNTASAELYLERLYIASYDYPALYWITRSLMDGLRSVMDVGGSVGIKYYAFKKELSAWPDLRWVVQDVPAVAERGRKFAAEKGEAGKLDFIDDFAKGDGVDVVYASGVLQYLPKTLPELLAGYKTKPRRIVINTAAIHPEREFFTVNSIGTAFCPYRIQTAQRLVKDLESMGYVLREDWRNIGKKMTIPWKPEFSLSDYCGYCLDLVRR